MGQRMWVLLPLVLGGCSLDVQGMAPVGAGGGGPGSGATPSTGGSPEGGTLADASAPNTSDASPTQDAPSAPPDALTCTLGGATLCCGTIACMQNGASCAAKCNECVAKGCGGSSPVCCANSSPDPVSCAAEPDSC